MYCESPEKAQPHIQPREDSPGLPLLMLSSVIREKLDVLQILHVWSAEHVARSLGVEASAAAGRRPPPPPAPGAVQGLRPPQTPYARRVRAEAALQGIAGVRRDLGLGDELCHLVANAPSQVPDVAVPLRLEGGHGTPAAFGLTPGNGGPGGQTWMQGLPSHWGLHNGIWGLGTHGRPSWAGLQGAPGRLRARGHAWPSSRKLLARGRVKDKMGARHVRWNSRRVTRGRYGTSESSRGKGL